jgi:hypothetical protein
MFVYFAAEAEQQPIECDSGKIQLIFSKERVYKIIATQQCSSPCFLESGMLVM